MRAIDLNRPLNSVHHYCITFQYTYVYPNGCRELGTSGGRTGDLDKRESGAERTSGEQAAESKRKEE